MSAVGSVEAEGCREAGAIEAKGLKAALPLVPWGRPKPRLRGRYDRVSRRLTSIEAMRAVGSALAKAVEQLGPYRPKSDKQRGDKGRGVGRCKWLPSSWSHRGRRLKSIVAMSAVRSAEAKATEKLGPCRRKADK